MLTPLDNQSIATNNNWQNSYVNRIKQEIADNIPVLEESKAEFELYIGMLDKAIKGKEEFYLPNSGKEHAAWMYSKMFDSTEEEFSLVVKDFSGDVSNRLNYLESLIKCLEKPNVKANILILKNPNKDSKAFNILYEYYKKDNKKVGIKIGKPEETDRLIQSNLRYDGVVVNWAIFDKEIYRLEINPNLFSAIGGFHDKKTALKLKTIFNEVYAAADDYDYNQ